jgi:hypothetical protein
VSMPLIYGEGKERALIRLREEVKRARAAVQDHSIFQNMHVTENNTNNFTKHASGAPGHGDHIGNVHWKVSRRTNALFTGRANLLRRLRDTLNGDMLEQRVFVIIGLGGLGKSEICLKIANEMRQEYIFSPFHFSALS